MAWVRIHDGALGHPKITGLIDLRNPFTLWVWGLTHCQMHLTDGIIVSDAVPKVALKAAAELVRRRLWETHDLGWKVHDYLAWNDCRDLVLERQEKAKERKEAWREREKERRAERRRERVPNTSGTQLEQRENAQPNQTKPVNTPQPPKGLLADDAASDRAAEFLQRYPDVYRVAKAGAYYHVREARDWPTALELVAQWPDVEYLLKMLELFLRKADWAPKNVPGSPGQFRHMAPECDALLRKHGHVPAESRVAS